MNWISAFIVALVIVITGLILSKILEKKKYEQQQALIDRKKERLQASAEDGHDMKDGELKSE